MYYRINDAQQDKDYICTLPKDSGKNRDFF